MDTTETVEKLKEWESWEREAALSHSIPELKQVGLNKADLLLSALTLIEAGEKDTERLDWLFENCKIIHWPGGGHYPIEHSPACNKDGRGLLEMARNKQGM